MSSASWTNYFHTNYEIMTIALHLNLAGHLIYSDFVFIIQMDEPMDEKWMNERTDKLKWKTFTVVKLWNLPLLKHPCSATLLQATLISACGTSCCLFLACALWRHVHLCLLLFTSGLDYTRPLSLAWDCFQYQYHWTVK